jgi:hypothetical protein
MEAADKDFNALAEMKLTVSSPLTGSNARKLWSIREPKINCKMGF